MPLPAPIIEVLAVFRPLFTAPTWRKLMTLLTGTLLAQGRRTITAALRASGNEQAGNWSLFHQVLNRARWSPLAVSRQLLLLIVETFVPAGASVDLVIDETLERRWGSKISKRGHYRNNALSSRERKVEQPWVTLDRDGSGCEPSLDQATLGFAFLVRTGNDSRSQ
jgi:DDE superfamily endonuclease